MSGFNQKSRSSVNVKHEGQNHGELPFLISKKLTHYELVPMKQSTVISALKVLESLLQFISW